MAEKIAVLVNSAALDGQVLSPERDRSKVMKGHLKATQTFISPNEIMFRPVVPPTAAHAPFNSANQRLYMSATLGRGGELERLSGRKSITRLPSPAGWDGHGVGRRFFMFPNASLTEDKTDTFFMELIEQTEPQRALVLAADDRSAGQIKEAVGNELTEVVRQNRTASFGSIAMGHQLTLK